MRYYLSGVFTGMALGMSAGSLLEKKLGWPLGEPRSYLLWMVLLLVGVVVGGLELKRRKG
jgi:hypothetical protein